MVLESDSSEDHISSRRNENEIHVPKWSKTDIREKNGDVKVPISGLTHKLIFFDKKRIAATTSLK